jgi:hypothetical protein
MGIGSLSLFSKHKLDTEMQPYPGLLWGEHRWVSPSIQVFLASPLGDGLGSLCFSCTCTHYPLLLPSHLAPLKVSDVKGNSFFF